MERVQSDPRWFPRGKKRAASVLHRIIPVIREIVRDRRDPSVTAIAKKTRSPFRVLVSTVISARTKDEVTGEASARLFRLAGNPRKMADLKVEEIEKAIFPAGFYRNKARAISRLSRMLISDFKGRVPDEISDLVKLPGVGRKTANLVVTLAFRKPGICVDTHVHRICNRLGVLDTRNPRETEFALREVLDRRHWIEINDLLVMYGQAICTPLSPRCSRCAAADSCARVGVGRSR